MTRRIATLSVIAVLALIFISATDQRLIAEKLITHFLLPYGFTWLILTVCLISAIWQTPPSASQSAADDRPHVPPSSPSRRWVWALGLVWLLMYLTGNQFISRHLMRSLDGDFAAIDLETEPPFDAVILLGGGTTTRPNGDPQINHAGDRTMTAARLYHAGKVTKFICTGSKISGLDRIGVDQSELAMRLLESVGVPKSAMTTIGGRNTSEEMAILAKQFNDNQRVGLLTSAWHLRRATRLASSQGLKTVPIPADFRSSPDMSIKIMDFVPSGYAAWINSIVAKEYLARAVGR